MLCLIFFYFSLHTFLKGKEKKPTKHYAAYLFILYLHFLLRNWFITVAKLFLSLHELLRHSVSVGEIPNGKVQETNE